MIDNIYEDLEMIMADRISEAYKKSAKYQKAITIENELFIKLKKVFLHSNRSYYNNISRL